MIACNLISSFAFRLAIFPPCLLAPASPAALVPAGLLLQGLVRGHMHVCGTYSAQYNTCMEDVYGILECTADCTKLFICYSECLFVQLAGLLPEFLPAVCH